MSPFAKGDGLLHRRSREGSGRGFESERKEADDNFVYSATFVTHVTPLGYEESRTVTVLTADGKSVRRREGKERPEIGIVSGLVANPNEPFHVRQWPDGDFRGEIRVQHSLQNVRDTFLTVSAVNRRRADIVK